MGWSEAGQVALQSAASLAVLFALTRLMGNRQLSQLTLFDYVAGISIGSIAAEMASHPEPEAWLGVEAMAIYAAATILGNIADDKSLRVRRMMQGQPLVLYDRGRLLFENFRKGRIDLTEFLTECRNAGWFDLSQLEMILLEINGKLSFLPRENQRPATPEDLHLTPEQSRPAAPVVMDGEVLGAHLKELGLDERWLDKQLRAQGYAGTEGVFLALVQDGALSVYAKEKTGKKS